jgi:4-amino-4-deoxy-L-arabinose transferase-like glycosyltransferase
LQRCCSSPFGQRKQHNASFIFSFESWHQVCITQAMQYVLAYSLTRIRNMLEQVTEGSDMQSSPISPLAAEETYSREPSISIDGSGPPNTICISLRSWLIIAAGVLAMIGATIFHYKFFLPHTDQPTKLYLIDSIFEIAVAALTMMSAATIGLHVLRFAPRGTLTNLERGLIAYGLGSGLLSITTALVGFLHGFYFPILVALLFLPLIIWWRDCAHVLRACFPSQPDFVLADLRPRTLSESAIGVLGLIIVAFISEHMLVPMWGFDVFMYHFALPKRFLALHTLFGSPGIPQANLPYNNEMLNLLALNFQAEIGAAIIQTIFVFGMCLAVYALGLRLLTRRAAWLGMAIFLVTPIVLYYASSGLIDQHFAFMALIAIIACLEYRDTHHQRWLLIIGLLAGIGLGVKYQFGYIFFPLLIALLIWIRPQRQERPLVGWLYTWGTDSFRIIFLISCGIVATFGFWTLREWIQVGNPFYPLIFGGAEWTPDRMRYYISQFDNFGTHNQTIMGRLTSIYDWYYHWQHYDYIPLPPEFAVVLSALSPGLLFLRAHDEQAKRVRNSIAFLLWLTLVSLILWSIVNQLIPRYVLPTFGLLALLTASVIDVLVTWLTRSLIRIGRDLAFAIAGALVLLPGLVFVVQQRLQNDPAQVYMGRQSYQENIRTTDIWPSYWRAVDYCNSYVPHNAHILGVNLGAGYFFDDPYLTPDMNRDIVFYLEQIANTDQQKLAWLRQHNYTYLIYDRNTALWSQQHDPDRILTPLLPLFEGFLQRQLILVRSLNGTDVYLIPPTT